MSSLTRIVTWSQELACEVLNPGDLAVDLTAGKGRDTLALANAVGDTGQVVSFDMQAAALEQTRELLRGHGYSVCNWTESRETLSGHGIVLVQACHSTLNKRVSRLAGAIIANLGYLPGGDRTLVTRPESTLAALTQSSIYCQLVAALRSRFILPIRAVPKSRTRSTVSSLLCRVICGRFS